MPQRLISSGFEKTKYLFIDGGCLDRVLQKFSEQLFGVKKLEIDYRKLAMGFQKVFYYDCLPIKKNGEDETVYQNRLKPKIELFNHLKSIDTFHVYEGTARLRDKKKTQEQKEIDIMIAVDMLTHSFHRNMDEATLLTGDLDFKPLIDALVMNGMDVSLWYPKGETNYELVDAADSRRAITANMVYGWFTDTFQKKVKIPVSQSLTSFFKKQDLNLVDKLENKNYKIDIYNETSRNQYVALVSLDNIAYETHYYEHDDLEQLKFYVNNIYSSNVYRDG
jgi:uncharacterized LabA/DUF88 family protein